MSKAARCGPTQATTAGGRRSSKRPLARRRDLPHAETRCPPCRRHSRGRGNPFASRCVTSGRCQRRIWIPAFAGMTPLEIGESGAKPTIETADGPSPGFAACRNTMPALPTSFPRTRESIGFSLRDIGPTPAAKLDSRLMHGNSDVGDRRRGAAKPDPRVQTPAQERAARRPQSRCAALRSRPAPSLRSRPPNSFLNRRDSLPRWVLRSFSSSLVSQAIWMTRRSPSCGRWP